MKYLKLFIYICLLIIVSCNATSPISEKADEVKGVDLNASFYIPNWNQPKTGRVNSNSRVINPDTTTVELYHFNGTSEVLIDTQSISINSSLELSDPNRIGTVIFSGLEAKKYNQGDLIIHLTDGSNILTRGENIGDITLTAQGSNNIEFSSLPYTTTDMNASDSTVTGTLSDGDMLFYKIPVIAQNTYQFDATRTSATGDLDVYIFDENGQIVVDDYTSENQNDNLTLYFAPDVSDFYYVAIKAFNGSGDVDYEVDTYDITLSTKSAIRGTVTFPSATAGNKVYFKYANDLVLTREIGRTGDTYLHYVIPNITKGDSGTLWVVVDRDGSSASAITKSANTGDYNSYTSTFSVNANHVYGKNLELFERFEISGTITVNPSVPSGTRFVMALIGESGWPEASYQISTESSTRTSLPYIISNNEPGNYRVLIIWDLDNSASSLTSLSNYAHIETMLTAGDSFYLSPEFTFTNSSITNLSGTTDTAAVVEGTITIPESRTSGNYVVFADSDLDYSNGVNHEYHFYINDFTGTTTFDYSLIVADGDSLYLGALVDSSGGEKVKSSGDSFGYLSESVTDTYTGNVTNTNFTLTAFDVGLSGSVTLPGGVDADGKSYMVGLPDYDIWSTPATVPVGTGVAGTFNYNLGYLPFGNNLEVVVVVDMDNNGLDNSPNFGDVIELKDGLSFGNSSGETLDFTNTSLAESRISGQILTQDSLSNKNYKLYLNGEEEDNGVFDGTDLDYEILFAPIGVYDVDVIIDADGDGFYGNSADYFGSIDLTIANNDMVDENINLTSGVENTFLVSGEIELPVDLSSMTQVIVYFENMDTNSESYERTYYINPDDDSEPDVLKYHLYNVEEGEYKLHIHTDPNNNGLIDSGEYTSYYPFGKLDNSSEYIEIMNDYTNLNFNVDSSSMN